MNLKITCTIALIMTLAAIMPTFIGTALIYGPMLSQHFHMPNLINAVIQIVTSLLQAGGLIVLLSTIQARLKDPYANVTARFVLAGILILLGILISTGLNLTHAVGLYSHLSTVRFLFYMAQWSFAFLSGITLCAFAFTCSGNRSSARTPAALALIVQLIFFGLSLVSIAIYFPQYFNNPSFIRTAGSLAMSLGHFVNIAAVTLFLLAFLNHRPWPPMAEILTPSPEPIPTLSAEELPPKHETN